MFWSKPKLNIEVKDKAPGYEETERSTPKAGYILLFAMFIAAVFFGWRALDDLHNVPQKPQSLSYCASSFIEYRWGDVGGFIYDFSPAPLDFYDVRPKTLSNTDCVFSPLEVKHGIPAVFEKRKDRDLKLRNLQLELNQVINNIGDNERQYNLGLTEKIAEEQKRLYPIPEIQQKLESLRQKEVILETEIDKLRAELRPLDDELKALYRKVADDYRREQRWYEFKIFLLEAIFVFPFFFLVFWWYRRLLAKNSPYTIIFTVLIAVASVLVLRVILTWFWGLFLASVIEAIWNFIKSFALLRSLVFYGGMVLSIAVFGGAVYWLQKKIFDPQRVAMRRIRQKQCPSCQVSLDLGGNYCPNCGRKLREQCPSCAKERWLDLEFCPSCQAKKVS